MKTYMLVTIGDKLLPETDGIGGDKSLLPSGCKVELVELTDGADPIFIGAFPTVETASFTRASLVLHNSGKAF